MDRHDLVFADSEPEQHAQLVLREPGRARFAINDHKARTAGTPEEGGDRLRTPDLWRRGAQFYCCLVGTENGVGVEDGQESGEVSVVSGVEEGIDELCVLVDRGVSVWIVALDPTAGPAGNIPGT